MWNSLKNIFKMYFITGLLVLGPLVISVYFIQTLIQGTDAVLQTSKWIPFQVPGAGVLLALIIILLAGFIGRNVFGKYIFSSAGEVLTHIPVIGTIYTSIQQVFDTLLGDRHKHFGRVVLIEYPHSGSWSMAFVTSDVVLPQIQKHFTEKMISVYVPTTPNPTSGFYLFVPEVKTKPCALTVEQAFKTIVSLGLVHGRGDE
jgi:uncharacterized membrane protein